jgi:hypothetical protein
MRVPRLSWLDKKARSYRRVDMQVRVYMRVPLAFII